MKSEDIVELMLGNRGHSVSRFLVINVPEIKFNESKKQILEALEFYDLVKNGEICNVMKHRELEQENKELKEDSDKWIKYLSESPTGTLKIILNLESQVKELTEEILKEKK